MKCQILFSRKYKKNIINLLSAEFTHSVVKVNTNHFLTEKQPSFGYKKMKVQI